MTSSMQALTSATPSGRSRALLVDSDAYAQRVARQGAPIPWLDLAALSGYFAQVTALLNCDAVWVDVGQLYEAHVANNPELKADMGQKSRAGFALRRLLGHEPTAASVEATLETIADAVGRPVVMRLPSPANWLGRAHQIAGTPVEEVSEDNADSAGMYVAEWLGRMGAVPVALVLLDAQAGPGSTRVVDAESLTAYSSIVNVAGHFGWTLGLRSADSVQTPSGDISFGVVLEEFWAGEGNVPVGDALLARIPVDAEPEEVLIKLRQLV